MRSWWSTARRRLALLWQLRRPADLFLCLRILCFAAAVPALFRLSLPRLQSLLAPRRAPRASGPHEIQKIISAVDRVLQVAPPWVRRGCLTRGLTLYSFLRRAGVDVSLCFGMGEVDGEFVGHCWLAQDGQPFLEREDPRPLFSEVYSIPQEPPFSDGARSTNETSVSVR